MCSWSATKALLGATIVSLVLAMLPAASAAASAGLLDSSFGTGGQSTVAVGSWAGAASVAVQPDGRIVTAGEADVNGEDVIVATRMLATGQLDPSFGTGGITTVAVNGGAGVDSGDAIAIQTDGKILIAGGARDGQYGPISFAAVRLNSNGTPDSSFGSDGVASVAIGSYSIANGIAIQSNGKIVLGGTALLSHNVFAAARLNANGTLDTSFGSGGVTTISTQTAGAWGLVLQPDGKVVLAGQAAYSGSSAQNAQQFMTVRLTSGGTPDTSFGQGGVVLTPIGVTALGFGIGIQSDGRLLVAGIAYTTHNVNAIVRLNTNGTIDRTYGVNGIGTITSANGTNGIALDSAGRPVLPLVGPGAERFNTNGTPDTTFGSGGQALVSGSNGGANGVAIQSNGNLVLAGATTVNGRIEISVIRLNASGATASAGTTSTLSKPKTVVRATVARACVSASRLPKPSSRHAHKRHRRAAGRRHRHGKKAHHHRRHRAARVAANLAHCVAQ